MSEYVKIRDVSLKYDISARALKYYEDMGLIASARGNDYAYRMYDEANIKKLEQILILRKLNISVKDIRRIFDTTGSEVVLEVLGKKVSDIDEEVALLHELKEIVIAFIRQIEQADFSKDSDVKSLYARAREIETQLVNVEYTGNPSPVHRLFEVAEKLEEKAASRLSIPENVLKRLLKNVYFIWGSNEGISVADELGCRYGLFVYHTCEYRYIHHKNADPKFQPELSRDVPDFFSLDPEDAMRRESGVVHDFTPMVIMDLIQLAAKHDGIICENAIDIDSIAPFITHAVDISSVTGDGNIDKGLDNFIDQYENAIRSRDISDDEKESLIHKLHVTWRAGKPENPRGTNPYGVKQITWDDHSTVERTADEIAEYFGLTRAE